MSLIPFAGAVQKFNRQRGGYQIERSLRFNSADSAYLNRTPGSAGNRKTWTWSGWVKRSTLGTAQFLFGGGTASTDRTAIYFRTVDTILLDHEDSNVTNVTLETSPVFRDVSAWYHLVFAVDTTQGTESNRIKLYVNGLEASLSGTYPSLNQDLDINSTDNQSIGASPYVTPSSYFNGYMTEIHFIDGSALDPTSFGEFNSDTGVWQPKRYAGTYGTNGFYLNFSDNSTTDALGTDFSGNDNTWDDNNFSVTAGAGNDSLVDSPTRYGTDTGAGGEVRGNYATLNALQDSATLANGNLDVTSLSSYSGRKATMQLPTTGKWYWETTVSNTSTTGGDWFIFGMVTNSFTLTSAAIGAANTIAFGDRNDSVSGIFNETSDVFQSASINFAVNDILQCAYDADSGKFWFGKNNSWYDSSGTTTGDPAAGSNQTLTASAKEWFPFFQGNNTSSAANMNFGQRPFAYTAPSGFKALCTTNLPEPTIADGSQYFNTVLYTGTGSARSVTGVGFQPDWVWVKERSSTSQHALFDAVRGVQKRIISDSTAAEDTSAQLLTAFNADGFSVGTDGALNENTQTYVAWNWKANGSGVSNTDGTISSNVSVNPTVGFSIVTWSGDGSGSSTVGHGLGVTPSFIIVKFRNAESSWSVYTASLGATKRLTLETTDAEATNIGYWNNTSPTSTVFTLGSALSQSYNYVAYCFAPVAGYSAFGSYTGNGSADGPFVYSNFRPAFLIVKRTDSTGAWLMIDSTRSLYNEIDDRLYPNLNVAEDIGTPFDFLSNGFKLRNTGASLNNSGGSYIYMAFAENPFAYALAR